MNGITGWRMQVNEPQCLSALLTPPEEGALVLTRAQALQLLETRREALRREGLVEWGEGILPQLAKQFAHSAYLGGLELEQEFLHLFPESLAVRTLLRFDAVCRYLALELHGFVQQLAVTRQEGLGHLAVCME